MMRLGVNVFYTHVYIDICIRISLEGHNIGTFYARKFKFGMILTQT